MQKNCFLRKKYKKHNFFVHNETKNSNTLQAFSRNIFLFAL